MEKEAEIVKDMYDLIDVYQVPCSPEDRVVYLTLANTITVCRNSIDKALTERDANINSFVTTLDKDIVNLTEECRRIKQQAQVNFTQNLLIFLKYCIQS